MTSTQYQFKVDITCEGCVNALKKSLNKTFGQQLVSIDANVSTQLVNITIRSDDKPFTYDEVYDAVLKCGKAVTKLS